MIDLPFDDLTDPLRLADWLELCALLSEDNNSRQGRLGERSTNSSTS